MKTLLIAILSVYLQPAWAAQSQFVWHLTVGPDVKVVGDEQVPFSAGDWNCVLTKNVGIDKKELRQLECEVAENGKTQLTAVCDDLAAYDMSNVALPQKKGGRITVGISCSTIRSPERNAKK